MAQSDKPHIDYSQVGEADWLKLSTTFLDAIQRFYEDPANLERFEKWQTKRQARCAAETT